MILGSLTKRSNKTQEIRDTKNFPQGNHKGENPTTSSKIESAPKVKPENIKMISRQQQSLSCPGNFSSHSCAPMSECVRDVCVINREAHSLFMFFRSLNVHSNMSSSLNNYLLDPTSLGDSNNPIAPQLVGNLPPLTNKEVYP